MKEYVKKAVMRQEAADKIAKDQKEQLDQLKKENSSD